MAEALGCRCIVASPCLVPYPAPTSFERRFRAAFPQLHHRLQAAGPGACQLRAAFASKLAVSMPTWTHLPTSLCHAIVTALTEHKSWNLLFCAGEVGWREVEHWLWPLFTDSWQRWRREALGLPAVPFLAEARAGAPLPPAPPLLYGLPELLVPRPGYWPDSVHTCGFWLDGRVSHLLGVLRHKHRDDCPEL